MWQKVVRDPKLILLVMVIFFAIIFLWDRGFDPEGIFVPPDLEPGIEFNDYRNSEKFNLDLEVLVFEEGENLYSFNWILEVETLVETPGLEIYGMLPLELEDYHAGEEIFPTWLRQEEKEDPFWDQQRVFLIEDTSKERISELAGWVKILIYWEEGNEFLEIKLPAEEINW